MIHIRRNGNVLSLDSDVLGFRSLLSTRRLLFHSDGGEVSAESEPLLDGPIPRPNAGLESAIRYHAMRHGYAVAIAATAPRACLPALRGIVDGRTLPPDPQLIRFVGTIPIGIVRYGARCDPVWIVAQVLQAFPLATTAIVVATHGEKEWWQRRLQQFHIDLDGECPDVFGQLVPRVVVATPVGLADESIHSRHLAIFPDALAATGERFQLALLATDFRARILAMLPATANPAPRQSDLLRSQFGFAEIEIPAHGMMPVDVRLDRRQLQVPPLPSDLEGLELRRHGVWRNHARNRMIVRLADSLGQASQESTAGGQSAGCVQERIIVLVECVEHAISMASRASRLSILTGPLCDSALPAGQRQFLYSRRPGWDPGNILIATPDGLAALTPRSAETIIWAGTGRHLPLISPHLLIAPSDAPRQLTIVDFDDGHHPILRTWCQRRRKAYHLAGWYSGGVDPERMRVERFLATRPGRA